MSLGWQTKQGKLYEKLRTYYKKEVASKAVQERMTDEPDEIFFNIEEVERHYHGWVCERPAHYLDDSKKMLQELIDAGVISEATKPTEWCNHGFMSQRGTLETLEL